MKPPALPRRLGHSQLAFVRCWAEGLDLVAAWNRYLYVDGPGDARRARGELQRLLDALRNLARAQGRSDIVTLLRRDPEAIVDRGPAPPTLEEFADQQPPDFYSQAELLDLYHEQVGKLDSRSSGRRRQRLRERLVLAVQWLERAGARDPQAADALAAWLDEPVVRRLAAAGLRTVGDLVGLVARKGFHWHRSVPRLGAQGAARIVRWITEHESTLGPLPRSALLPPRRWAGTAVAPAPRLGVVPLERLLLPPDRDGTHGSNRAAPARGTPPGRNDLDAVRAWLSLRAPGSHTWRAYRKEAERFLLWAVLQQRKPLSSLDGSDCEAYRRFLEAPAPGWVGPRGALRSSEGWRPFEGPLSPRSAAMAVVIVRGLCGWLVERGHLASNPWLTGPAPAPAAAPEPPPAPTPAPPLRALSPAQWARVTQWLAVQTPSPALRRLRLALVLGSTTGLRLAELAASRRGWLQARPRDDGAATWVVQVPARQGKGREVPVADAALAALQAHLRDRGLGDDISALPAATPLIARLDGAGALSAGRLYEVLVTGFERCAAESGPGDGPGGDVEKIREASARWLRHTFGMRSLAAGMPRQLLRARLGHASLAASAAYVRAVGLWTAPGGEAEALREPVPRFPATRRGAGLN